MRYVARDNAYKASNFLFEVDSQQAWSYGWWLFSVWFNGYFIVNETNYSNTTSRHQRKARGLYNQKPDLILRHTRCGLQAPKLALRDEIKGTLEVIRDIEAAMNNPRSRKKKNEERKKAIAELRDHINTVIVALGEPWNTDGFCKERVKEDISNLRFVAV